MYYYFPNFLRGLRNRRLLTRGRVRAAMAEEQDEDSPVREVALESACPMCGAQPLLMRSLRLDIPYFGDALQTTVLCRECGFRHADVIHTELGAPTRNTLRVRRAEDVNARVVRSSSCTIRIPEVGAVMEPGPQSEAFISNVEGVLGRFRDILGFLVRNAESDRRRAEARASLRAVDEMVEGRRPFTVILDDPFGNSGILHDEAEVRPLTEHEVKNLKTGMFVLEPGPSGVRPRASP